MSSEFGIRDSGFAQDGFQIFKKVISREECDLLAAEMSERFHRHQITAKNKIGGVRNLLTTPSVSAIVCSERLNFILKETACENFFPVRAIFFDKTNESNWCVPWHQDLAIAVAEKIETAGLGGWSIKGGVHHVQPSREILESMATIRLHLDDCDADNGALKVVPRSHSHGILEAAGIDQLAQGAAAVVCEVPKGGVLLMRPLLLHSSSRAKNPAHRRVLHIEFASAELPNGLKWFERQ